MLRDGAFHHSQGAFPPPIIPIKTVKICLGIKDRS